MIHSIDPGILFLKQEDVLKAGLLDMKQVIADVEKTYEMLGKGLVRNPPKVRTRIPDDEVNWNSFFNSMPCYIGGDINVAGIKWAAESRKNAHTPGIPYGIDITILSDPETVLPFCILEGSLITAMRTSAVAGVFAKYTAPVNTTAATLVGAGVIGRTMLMAMSEALPSLETIYLCDIDVSKAEKLAQEYNGKLKAKIIPTADSKGSALQSQVIVTETTAKTPFIDASWIKKGITLINMASNEAELDVVRAMDAYYIDYWKQMITYNGKAITQLYNLGEIAQDGVTEMADLVLGNKPGRVSGGQTLYCSSMGIGALDIMVSYRLFNNAMRQGIGTLVKLWDTPAWE
ncbi:MAG: ornithine cyclodeaminase family protein [Oscillospiraceae bacterium]|nr:ornithine cyclodeaminase family protein [Oscillospiraceae bacterium]